MKRKTAIFLLSAVMALSLSAPAAAADFTASEEAPAFDSEDETVFSAGDEAPEEDSETPEEAPPAVTEDGISYEYVPEQDYYRVVKGADREEVTLPLKLYGRYVTEIGEGAFRNCTKLRKFRLEGEGKEVFVRKSAFEGCTQLRSVWIPDGFSIESNAFKKCPRLKLFQTTEGVFLDKAVLSPEAFDKDTGVYFTTGEVPHSSQVRETLKSLGILNVGVYDSDDLYEIYDGVTYANDGTCPDGTAYAVNFEEGVRTVDVRKITVSEPQISTVIIGRRAFYGSSAETVFLSEKVKSVKAKAFYDCPKLKKIIIPASVTSIASDAFTRTPNVVIYTPKNSYAWKYAKKKGIAYKEFSQKNMKAPKLTYTRTANKITLKWDAVPYADKYEIYTGKSDWNPAYTVDAAKGSSFTFNQKVGDTTRYQVRVYSDSGKYRQVYSPFSNSVKIKYAPNPTKLTAVSSEKKGSLTVSWKIPKGAAGFIVYRSEISGYKNVKKIKTIASKTAAEYKDSNVKKGKTYYYRVRAFSLDGKNKIYGELSKPMSAKCR